MPDSPEPPMHNLTVERLRQLPVHRTDEVWEVAIVSMPMLVRERRNEKPFHPLAGVCVSTRGGGQLSPAARPTELPQSAALDALAAMALEPQAPGQGPINYLPGRVHISAMPLPMAERLSEAMGLLGVIVETKPELPNVAEFMRFLAGMAERDAAGVAEDGRGAPMHPPPLMGAKGMTVERIAAFADAAAAFYTARPWRLSPTEVLWRIEPEPKERGLRHCVVLGAARQEFGLGFMADAEQMEAMAAANHPGEVWENNRSKMWALTFDPIDVLPVRDAVLWEKHGLKVAGDRAYPLPLGVGKRMAIVRPTPTQLTFMEALLRVWAGATREDVRPGRYERQVAAFGGPVKIVLTVVRGR